MVTEWLELDIFMVELQYTNAYSSMTLFVLKAFYGDSKGSESTLNTRSRSKKGQHWLEQIKEAAALDGFYRLSQTVGLGNNITEL